MLALLSYPVLALSRSTPPTSPALGTEERRVSLLLRSAARDPDRSHPDLDSVLYRTGSGFLVRRHLGA
jgi:hypothetical protein